MKRSDWLGAWFSLARTAVRSGEKLGRAAGRGIADQAAKHAPGLRKNTERLLSGVATPTARPATGQRGRGKWEEGVWGLGPFAMRRYLLFLPPGTGLRRPAPLLMLLHGCGQDAASFAATTRAATAARTGGYAVLLPEQAREANTQRCWNWFRGETAVATEAAILLAILEHVCRLHPLRRDRIFAFGLSAGGAMALTLALRYPGTFAGVGSHSGAAPGSAGTPLQAGQAMRGRRGPDVDTLRRRLAGRPLPPLLVVHGGRDHTVTAANAGHAVDLWLELSPEESGAPKRKPPREVRRGARHAYTVSDWTLAGRPCVRRIEVPALGHAWSGGARKQAFSDPDGPDALRLAWAFFRRCVGN